MFMKIINYNVIPDLSGPTPTPWTLDLTEHHGCGPSTVLHSISMTEPPEPLLLLSWKSSVSGIQLLGFAQSWLCKGKA